MRSQASWVVSAILLAVVVWLGAALARVENERYALATGLCKYDPATLVMFDCLKTVVTRTGWWWNVWYALKG
jgi:hypothetical protein